MKLKKVFMTAAITAATLPALAQAPQMPLAPNDTAVRVGHLENGLTYYIRHNEYPKGKANFYIAQKVGAIEEEDNQNGLAHFLEHMAFNGSKHFPGDAADKYIKSLGAFSNAYTKSDNTVYYIDGVTTERQSAIDSCLLVLSDWSCGLTLNNEEIQVERDVVHNEFRTHSAMQRVIFDAVQGLFPDSKYGKRTIIGDMNVIDHSDPKSLREYYEKWYFPGNQAVVVVGDFDVDKVEATIKRLFEPLKAPKTATKALYIPTPDNEQTLYAYGSNKEITNTIFFLNRKLEDVPFEVRNSLPYYMQQYLQGLSSLMFSNRMRKLTQDPKSALMQASTQASYYGNTQQNFTRPSQLTIVVPKAGKEKEAYQEIFRELNRIGQFGFTASEYKQAKEAFKTSLETQFNNRATITNNSHAQDLITNFLTNDAYPSIEQEKELVGSIIDMLPLDAVNEMSKALFNADAKNLGVIAAVQEVDGKATIAKDELEGLAAAGRADKVEQLADNVKEEPLMTTMPKAGKIVKEKENKALGAKELTLSNGIKVLLKKTDYKADQIIAAAVARGGSSVLNKESMAMKKLFSTYMNAHKLGTKGYLDLVNLAQTTQTMVSPSLTNDIHSIQGSSNNANLETLMQELNLSFTGVSKDEAFFQQIGTMIKTSLNAKKEDPSTNIEDSLSLYQHNKDVSFLSPEASDVDAINYDRVMAKYAELFGNPGEFQFSFVGSFDESAIRPLIEKYIASLPVNKKKTEIKDARNYTNGKVYKEFTMKMENPQSVTRDFYRSAPVAYNLQNEVNAKALGRLLFDKMFEIIREKESAAYTPMPSARLENDLNGTYFEIDSEVSGNPDKNAVANKLITEIIEGFATKVEDADAQKAREAVLKSYNDAVKTNSFWADAITDFQLYGVDKATGREAAIKAITPASLSNVVKQILKSGNHVRVVMKAEKK